MWALKFRPRKLEDLVGQETVVRIIWNILNRYEQNNRDSKLLPNSIILEGPFGAGKTTSARILARYLNCEQGPLTACGECKSCKDIEHDRSRNLVEMDAATNRGIADIGRIKELLGYKVAGNYRVVIMDEAHQITKDGWAALLKVLEEGTPNTMFVFATTDSHKILDTIRSRSTVLKIGLVHAQLAAERVKLVCAEEGYALEESVADTIGFLSRGHMRDCLQLAETSAILSENNTITLANVYAAAGLASVDETRQFIQLFFGNDLAGLQQFVASYNGDTNTLLRSARLVLHGDICSVNVNDEISLADKLSLYEQLTECTVQINALNLEFPFVIHYFRRFQQGRAQAA